MKPMNDLSGHRFGVNRILRLGDDLLSAGRDGVVRRWDVSSVVARGGGNADTARRDGARKHGRTGGQEGGRGGLLFCCLPYCSHLIIDHASFSRRSTLPRGGIVFVAVAVAVLDMIRAHLLISIR